MEKRNLNNFWVDELGNYAMPLLTASIASFSGVALLILGSLSIFIFNKTEGLSLIQIGSGLIGAAAGLSGWQSNLETKNKIASKNNSSLK